MSLLRKAVLKILRASGRLKTYDYFYLSSGFTGRELRRPLIAIVNSPNDFVIGHQPLSALAKYVREGILEAGGTPVEFSTIGPCAGYCKERGFGTETLHYDLPQRDVIADSVEVMLRNLNPDGVVCIGTCDKSIPGLWLGISRFDKPTIFFTGGPAIPGEFGGETVFFPSDLVRKAFERIRSGENPLRVLKELESGKSKWVLTCGACPEMTTANTTQMCVEAMGLCLPGVSTMPPVFNEKVVLAKETGYAIVQMVKEGMSFRKLVTKEAIEDALRVVFATAGGTNAILHLLALADSLRIPISVEEIDRISSSTPYICSVAPCGKFSVPELHIAGGVYGIMKSIEKLIHKDRLTVSGRRVGEILRESSFDGEIIRSANNPVREGGSIVVLKGNIAPVCAIARPVVEGVYKDEFVGRAKCFDDQERALECVAEGSVKEGDVLIIRYQGPRGGPGYVEDFKIVLLLEILGIRNVAVITDGRFSGATRGALYVGYVCPEAQVGGPIGVVRDGDEVKIDLKNKRVDVLLSDEEINRRMREWKPKPPRFKEGILVEWFKSATQFDRGAVLERRFEG